MKYLNTFLILLIIGLTFYLCYMYLSNFVYPHTYLGDVNISGKTRTEVAQFITTRSLDTIEIEINTRIYSFSYSDLGVLFYKEKALTEIFEPNQHPFFKYIQYLTAIGSERIIAPPLEFSQDFYTFIDNATFTFIDPQTKQGKKYQIDAEALKTQLSLNFGKKERIQATLLEKTDQNNIDPSIIARRVSHVTEKPVNVIIQTKKNTSQIALSKAEVKGISSIQMNPETADVNISIDKNALQNLIQTKDAFLKNIQSTLFQEDIKNNFITLLKKRLDGLESDVIVTNVENKAQTTGDRAEKYIEVNIASKKIYLFEGGKVIQSVPLLSHVCAAVQEGSYNVKTKARSTYSASHDTWIPYWVAFSLDKPTNSLLGIHEAPYKKEGDKAKPKIKPKAVKTESCISLPIGQAEQVYEFASVNMPVYVFK